MNCCGCGPIVVALKTELPDPCTTNGLCIGQLAFVTTIPPGSIWQLVPIEGLDPDQNPCGRDWVQVSPGITTAERDLIPFSGNVDLDVVGSVVGVVADGAAETPEALLSTELGFPVWHEDSTGGVLIRLSVTVTTANPTAAVDFTVLIDGAPTAMTLNFLAAEVGTKDADVPVVVGAAGHNLDLRVSTTGSAGANLQFSAVVEVQRTIPTPNPT